MQIMFFVPLTYISQGYLRCGKILQLKGQNELALKIYERGLLKVKIGTDDKRVVSGISDMFGPLMTDFLLAAPKDVQKITRVTGLWQDLRSSPIPSS